VQGASPCAARLPANQALGDTKGPACHGGEGKGAAQTETGIAVASCKGG